MIHNNIEWLKYKAQKGDANAMMALGDYYSGFYTQITSAFTVADFFKANDIHIEFELRESNNVYENSTEKILYIPINTTEIPYLVFSKEAAIKVKSGKLAVSNCCITHNNDKETFGIITPYKGFCFRLEADYSVAIEYYLYALSEGLEEAEDKLLIIANNIKENAEGIDTTYDFDTEILYFVMGYDDPKLDKIRHKLMVALTSIPFNSESSINNRLFRNNKNQYYLKDMSGKIVVPIGKYDFIAFPSRNLCLVRKGEKFGLIGQGGIEILPAIYDCISNFEDLEIDEITVSKDGKRETLNLLEIFPGIEKICNMPPDGIYDLDAFYGNDPDEDYDTRMERMADAYLDGEGSCDDYDP